ncbi:YfiR family protein [Novosphingobium album (ex Liu et al. 2023)]|uniref:YfiR family protein n=1 Tax=Novosphingobium album (ex Liu et al. 2023) TaxID=3031130 RepID=A0ABT5WL51_9SPHN|nr:YfiR family protein [Novosphingobium album (ex Liu et al. 2023)]MDE8650762.1 YfiR family protein [Novosphingobium album (ex Liu et al. 2023)]
MLRPLLSWVLASAMAPTLAGIPLQGGEDRTARATAQIVTSILEYTRWPTPTNPVQLCVVGPALHAGGLTGLVLSDGRPIQRIPLPAGGPLTIQNCDALYIGRLSQDQARRWTAATRGAAVLTIAEDDPECRSEAMFCLLFQPGSLSFRLSIDAVARSRVRVDPRVLRLAREP